MCGFALGTGNFSATNISSTGGQEKADRGNGDAERRERGLWTSAQ